MGKPSIGRCAVLLYSGENNIRVARVGGGPLVTVWVNGRGIILDVDQTEELIDGLDELLDEIEG